MSVGAGPVMRARVAALPPNVRGALWVLLAGIFFSVMGVLIKLLGERLDSFQIAFFRALFGLLAVLPFVWGIGLSELKTQYPVKHLVRGIMGVTAMFCGFYAITHLALADAVAFTFTRPLFLIPLAVLFLGEQVRARRWTATGVGFIGVLIMLRPGGSMELAALVAIVGAFLVAAVSVLIKQLTVTEKPTTLLFYFGIVSTTVALGPALLVWTPPTWQELLMMAAVGACGASAQTCMIRGFAVGEATAVVPFDYARLIFAGLFGFFIFTEVPDLWTVAGALLLVGSTLYIALREARLGRPKRPPVLDQGAPGPPRAGLKPD